LPYTLRVRRFCVAALLALIVLLPAVDAVFCPDGCAEAGRTRCAWQTDLSAAADGCGLCVNGVAVHGAPPYIAPSQRIQAARAPRAIGAVLTVSRPIDQPPRRS
jgi:hypothetical protein